MTKFIWILVVISFLFPVNVLASKSSQFITLVNPVRISIYSKDPVASLKNQYQRVLENNLPASWLFTYDALVYPGLKEVIKTMDENQDIGVWVEISENFSKNANVNYNKTDSWHRANSIFLSGYKQEDRIKLIDTIFEKFKDEFGKYPTSVGAWWIDSFSLEYMQKKYAVSANLIVADQIGTDGYTIWGQPWAMPYYPSRNHAAIPAQNLDKKIDIVNFQWAPRDPLNGYKSPNSSNRSSLYSTQDYYTIGLGEDYLEKLIELYAGKNQNAFGQITFGLEGDLSPDAYSQNSQFEKYLQTAVKHKDNYQITNMKQFSEWYRQKYPQLPKEYIIESDDLLGSDKKSIWFQNSNYRVGLVYDPKDRKLRITDLRIYQQNFQEPFYLFKNGQIDLDIIIPAAIDTSIDPQRFLEIENIDSLKTSKKNDVFEIQLSNKRSILFSGYKISFNNINNLPEWINQSNLVSVQEVNGGTDLVIAKESPIKESGYYFKSLTAETSYFLRTKKAKIILGIFSILILFLLFLSVKLKNKKGLILASFALVLIGMLLTWYFKNLQDYFVSQSEIETLKKLSTYPEDKVLVLDRDCLHCSAPQGVKPAVFVNKRDYVEKFANKKIIYDNKLIESYSSNQNFPTSVKIDQAKEYLKNLSVQYIYLVKYEDYLEKLPFSPGDLNVERIYFNANSEIWRVKS